MTLAIALLLLQDAWEYRAPVRAFVNPATLEQKAPDDLFALGERLFSEGEPGRARVIFQSMAQSLPADVPELQPLRERSLFAAARSAYASGDFAGSYAGFETFLARYPDGDLAAGLQGARYYLCQSAFNLAQVGEQASVLGLPLYRTSKAGIELLRKSLSRFPRESFSDDFIFALGEFLFQQGRFDEARTEFETILLAGNYEKTNSAPKAQLRLARLSLAKFDGVDYDVKMLADAKREYEKFLSSWARAAGDPRTLAALELTEAGLEAMVLEARKGIAEIDEKLAEKQWTLAQYYVGRGRPASARAYLRTILSDFPSTSWAPKARELLEEIGRP